MGCPMNFGRGLLQFSPENLEAFEHIKRYGPLALSIIFMIIGLTLTCLVSRRVHRRMTDLCGEGWEKEWYEHVEVKQNDPIVKRYKYYFFLPSHTLYMLGVESTILGWSRPCFQATSAYIVAMFFLTVLFEDRFERYFAKWAKSRADKEKNEAQPKEQMSEKV